MNRDTFIQYLKENLNSEILYEYHKEHTKKNILSPIEFDKEIKKMNKNIKTMSLIGLPAVMEYKAFVKHVINYYRMKFDVVVVLSAEGALINIVWVIREEVLIIISYL